MNKKEFLNIVGNANVSLHKKVRGKYGEGFDKCSELNLDTCYLYEEWVSGGTSGGSCWDSGESHHYATGGEPEPEFKDLDTLLTCICPNITYLQYKSLAAIINFDSYDQNEYYGNSTIYSYKYVLLKDLYEKLVEMGIIDE